jgi:exodeoxyribonuclease-3
MEWKPQYGEARESPLRIATFNINNINKRLANLIAWLETAKPDVVCLQELKAEQNAFPESALRQLGYRAVWHGQRSWNGVAIIARDYEPVLTRSTLPGDDDDHQARYIEAAVNGVLVASIYLPNGNPQPGPKFDYKLAWFDRLTAHAADLMSAGVPVVLAGDYNVVPTPQDIYQTRSLDNNALVQPQSRAAFARLLSQGWTDALRTLCQTDHSGRSGTMNVVAGLPIKACASTTSCYRRISPKRLWTEVSIAKYAANQTPATTPRPGSCSTDKQQPWLRSMIRR